jgi:hypothetical protein
LTPRGSALPGGRGPGVLSRPGFVVWPAVGLAAFWHPDLPLGRLPFAPALCAALALVVALALIAQCGRDGGRRAVAAGAVLALVALGWDGAFAHRGQLTLGEGQTVANFEELGPAGRPLGLRPLGFDLRLDQAKPSGDLVLLARAAGESRRLAVGATRAIGHLGQRLGSPQPVATGAIRSLGIGVTGADRTLETVVGPGRPGRAGDLEITLVDYFPEFALDATQRPFTRSNDPLRPAALLDVGRGAEVHRVLVMAGLPDLHRVDDLGLSFSLRSLDPEMDWRLAVAAEPAAPGLLAGVLLMAFGLAVRRSAS